MDLEVTVHSDWDMECSNCPGTRLDCVLQGQYCQHNGGISYKRQQSYVDCHHENAGTRIVYRKETGVSRVPIS